MPSENLLTLPQAADRLGVARSTVWRWCHVHGLGRRLGFRHLIEAETVRRLKAGETPAEIRGGRHGKAS